MKFTIENLMNQVESDTSHNGWSAVSQESILLREKFLEGEVGELMEAGVDLATEARDPTKLSNFCSEVYDVLWNLLDYARLHGVTAQQLEEGFASKIEFNNRRWSK